MRYYATLEEGPKLSGTLQDGGQEGITQFTASSIAVAHSRHRELQYVKVYVLSSLFGSVGFGSDDFGISESALVELNPVHYTVTYDDLDNFTVQFDNVYKGEIRFA